MTAKINLELFLDDHSTADYVPSVEEFRAWVQSTIEYTDYFDDAEISFLIVDEHEGAQFNHEYRKKEGPTNTLAIPIQTEKSAGMPLVGDIVMCANLINQEAHDRDIENVHHWTHLTIHSSLHIIGYDHINEDDANVMQNTEREILQQFGIGDPYEFRDGSHE